MNYLSFWQFLQITLPPSAFHLSVPATTVLVALAIIFFIISFLTSGSEVAFFTLSGKEVDLLKTRERPGYRRIVSLLDQPKTLITSLLISNTFFNIAIILILNILLSSWLPFSGPGAFFVKLLGIVLFIVLFAEVLPKVWATHHKIFFASNASLVVEIVHSLFFGLSRRLISLGDRFIDHPANTYKKSSQSNFDEVIDMLPEDTATLQEKDLLKGIRKFGNIEVKQIMHTRMDVHGIEAGSNFHEVLQLARELHYSRLPVYKSNLDEIMGMIHTKDLLPHLNEAATFDWHTLIRQAYFIHEKKSLEDLLHEFRTKRIHFAVVVDEFGGTSGIVTLEDIIEEVIGDIRDEFDDETSVNKKIDDYNYIFEGKIMIHEACKAMGLPADAFDDFREDSDSLGGLVLEIAGEFPNVNEQFIAGNYIFTPLEINKNRIDKVQITIQHA